MCLVNHNCRHLLLAVCDPSAVSSDLIECLVTSSFRLVFPDWRSHALHSLALRLDLSMLCVLSLESTISSRCTLRADSHLKYMSLSCVMLSAPLLIVSLMRFLDCCSLEMSCSRLENISQVHRVPWSCSQPDHCWRGILRLTLDDSLFAPSLLISQVRSCSSCSPDRLSRRDRSITSYLIPTSGPYLWPVCATLLHSHLLESFSLSPELAS